MPTRITTRTIPLSHDDLHGASDAHNKIQSTSLPALNHDSNARPRAKSERPASAIPQGRRAAGTSNVSGMLDMPSGPPRRAASAALRPQPGSRRRIFAPITSPHNGSSSRANSAGLLARIKRTVLSIVDVRGGHQVPNFDDEEVPLSLPPPPTSSSLRVFVGTWNMCGTLPSDLSPFLPAIPEKRDCFADLPHTIPLPSDYRQERDRRLATVPAIRPPGVPEGVEHPFHLMVIATQECQKSISESVMFPSKAAWEQQLADAFGAEYDMVACATMAALHLCVLVWRPCAKLVSRVESSSVPTGIGGVVGNKGGVGVALDFGPTSLLFVNVHLTAHQENVGLRNADYLKIETSLDLPLHMDQFNSAPAAISNVAAAMLLSPAGSIVSLPRNRALASDAVDYAIYTGDTNYRVEANSWNHVTKLLEEDKLDTCLQNDQLALHRRAGNTFIGFQEAPIRFLPTFKLSTTAPSIASGSIGSNTGGDAVSPSLTKRRGSFWTAKVASVSRRSSLSPGGLASQLPSNSAMPVIAGSSSGVTLEIPEAACSGSSTHEIQQQRDKTRIPSMRNSRSRSEESLPVLQSGATNDITDLLSICSNEISVATSAASVSMATAEALSPDVASPDTSAALPNMPSPRPRPAVGGKVKRTKLLPKLRTSGPKSPLSMESDSPIARKYNPQRIPAWTDRILFKAKQDRLRAMEAAMSVTATMGTTSMAMSRMESTGPAVAGDTSDVTNDPAVAMKATLPSPVAGGGTMDVFTESGTRLPSNTEIFNTSNPSIAVTPQTTTLSLPPPPTSAIAVPVYTAVHEQTGSDHAPVVGVFDLPFDWAAFMAEMPMGSAEALANHDISAVLDLDLARTASGGGAFKTKVKKTRWILSWRGSDKSLGKVSPAPNTDEDVVVPGPTPLTAGTPNSVRKPSFAAPEEPVDVDYLLNLNPSLPRQTDAAAVSGSTVVPPEPPSADASSTSGATQNIDNEAACTVAPQLTSFRDTTAIVSATTSNSPPTSTSNVATPLPPLPTLSRVPRPRAASTGLPNQPHKLQSRGRAHGKTSRKASLLPGGVPHSPSTPKLPTMTRNLPGSVGKTDSPATSSQPLSPSTPSMASTSLSVQTNTTGGTGAPTRALSYTARAAPEESVYSQRTADVLSMSEVEEARRVEAEGASKGMVKKSRRGWLRRKKNKVQQQQAVLVSPAPSENDLQANGKPVERRRRGTKMGDPCSIM